MMQPEERNDGTGGGRMLIAHSKNQEKIYQEYNGGFE